MKYQDLGMRKKPTNFVPSKLKNCILTHFTCTTNFITVFYSAISDCLKRVIYNVWS